MRTMRWKTCQVAVITNDMLSLAQRTGSLLACHFLAHTDMEIPGCTTHSSVALHTKMDTLRRTLLQRVQKLWRELQQFSSGALKLSNDASCGHPAQTEPAHLRHQLHGVSLMQLQLGAATYSSHHGALCSPGCTA